MIKKTEGALNLEPRIVKLTFEGKGKMEVHLLDGRIIVMPIDMFPEIKKLTAEQRKKFSIIGGEGFTFDACIELFHLAQVLGNYNDYKYSFVHEGGRTFLKRKN